MSNCERSKFVDPFANSFSSIRSSSTLEILIMFQTKILGILVKDYHLIVEILILLKKIKNVSMFVKKKNSSMV